MRDDRGPWYLFTGLILGLAIGLVYAWVISPVRYVDTTPAALRADFKDQYRALIAVAYLSSGDLERAKARLQLLQDENLSQKLAIQLQVAQSAGAPESEIRGLALLIASLNPELGLSPPSTSLSASPTAEATFTLTPTPVVLTLTPTSAQIASQATMTASITLSVGPLPTVTPLPTLTPSPTPGAPFILKEQNLICETAYRQPSIQVEAFDAAGQPVPGIELIVNWPSGEDHFFTGLKSEISPGFADFAMTPGIVYTLRLADGGEAVTGLTATECEARDGSRYWGSWKLIFIQP